MKTTVSILLVICGLVCGAAADFRVWSSKDGVSNVEAQFIQISGSKVVLEKKDGARLMVPMNKLCAKDQDYLAGVVPPDIKIDVDRNKSSDKIDETGYSTRKKDTITIDATIKKVSKSACTQNFKAYLYLIAESYSGSSRVVIGKSDVSFSFAKKDSAELKASGSVSYYDSYGSGKSGWEYEGYIVVVENTEGQVVAVDTNKSVYESKLSVIKTQQISTVDTYSTSDYKLHTFNL